MQKRYFQIFFASVGIFYFVGIVNAAAVAQAPQKPPAARSPIATPSVAAPAVAVQLSPISANLIYIREDRNAKTRDNFDLLSLTLSALGFLFSLTSLWFNYYNQYLKRPRIAMEIGDQADQFEDRASTPASPAA